MIPAIFDRWVHPWRRAEKLRSSRLGAPAVTPTEIQVVGSELLLRWCASCDVKWAVARECWNCGRPA